MVNVYDILLNLLDSNRVYEFFEWSKNDNIEHIKKIPLIKISSNNLNDIIMNNIIIDNNFLDGIYKKTEIYNEDKIGVIDYCSLFTDGYRVLAIEFNKDGKSLFKSFLLLDEEEEILDMSIDLRITSFKYKVIKNNNNYFYLTREEEFRKNYLLKELKISYKKKMYEKINYLYEEIYSTSKKSIEDKYEILIDDITNNYNSNHNKLFKILKLTHKKKKTASN